MVAARVESTDLQKLEVSLAKDSKSLQDFFNCVVRSYVSGTLTFSGSHLVGGAAGGNSTKGE